MLGTNARIMATSETFNITFQGFRHIGDVNMGDWLRHHFADSNVTVGRGLAVNGIPHNHILVEKVSK